jgi:hypothetical protein
MPAGYSNISKSVFESVPSTHSYAPSIQGPSTISHSKASMGSGANRFLFETKKMEQEVGTPFGLSAKTRSLDWGGSEGIQ